jgi:hypothetical protein
MKGTTSNCTRCNFSVKSARFADLAPPELKPPALGGVLAQAGIPGPRVEFIPCKFGDAWRFKSSCQTVRICISPRKGLLRLDGDWYSAACFELAPHAGDAIQSRWTGERELHPKSRVVRHCGGLATCLIVDIYPEREMSWRRFLRDLLGDPTSWWYFDWSVLDYRPFDAISHSAPSGNQQ